MLGSGIPLWTGAGADELVKERALRLESSRAFESGLVQNRYVVDAVARKAGLR